VVAALDGNPVDPLVDFVQKRFHFISVVNPVLSTF